MMDWYGHGMDAGDWVGMIAVMTLFWGLVILAGIAIFRGAGGIRGTRGRDALEILDERFARGEVDHEEYEARRAALRGSAR